ncbi:hypothetical protein [Microcella sp.]|uniref:hypothetical protein n=1 Tax=Microcella sp. TaxID=1913979 RepID=UPI002562F5B3|nr:hypothetical protein [Microcella sp.]MBX9472912.1 hypothetical protein [Microcella sp.]
MSRAPSQLPLAVHGEVLSTAEARRLGVLPDRQRRADVLHPFHGVAAFCAPLETLADRAWAYAQVMSQLAWFSNTTAAALRGLPLPSALEQGPLHVTVPRGAHTPRATGVIGHQRDLADPTFEQLLLPCSTGELVPLRVATIGTTLLTAATDLGLPDLVALVDAARFADDLSALAEIERMLARSSRRAGAAALRRATALSRAGVRSRPESHLRLLLTRAGLPEPEVAPEVSTPIGPLHPDLAWPSYRVLVEYEGDGHRTNPRVFARDLSRFDAFADAEWSAIRCTREELYSDPSRVLGSAARRLRARGWRTRSRLRSSIPPLAKP